MINPLQHKKLYYLIGLNDASCVVAPADSIIEVGYDSPKSKQSNIIAVKYCNLVNEKNSGKLGPYLINTDTARDYGEGVIDPTGEGWNTNITNQAMKAVDQTFEYVEWDNPDAYNVQDILKVYDLMEHHYGLKCIAKNPLLMGNGAVKIIQHPNVWGCIVEWDEDLGTHVVNEMYSLLAKANRQLPIWFVNFGHSAKTQAEFLEKRIKIDSDMYSCYASKGEYKNCIQI